MSSLWRRMIPVYTFLEDAVLSLRKEEQFGKHLLFSSEIRQEHWSSLLKFAKTPRGFSNLKVNSGMRIGPTRGLSARR